jgi:hypothetical protein
MNWPRRSFNRHLDFALGKLAGAVELVGADVLPNDGKVIADQR